MSINVCTREEKDQIAELIAGFRFAAGFGKTLNRLVRHGIGVHHAGMLPKYRRLVEQLAQAGLLKVICGTDTLGRGHQRAHPHRAAHRPEQVRRRAHPAAERPRVPPDRRPRRPGRLRHGRAPWWCRRPEHVIENVKAMAKATAKFGDDQKKLRQVVKKKPPDGFVSWGEPTYKRLVESVPEPLTSSFTRHPRDAAERAGAPRGPVRRRHAACSPTTTRPRASQLRLMRKALGIYRELLAAGVVERIPPRSRTPTAARSG